MMRTQSAGSSFTTKADLRGHPPQHFWRVPLADVVRLHASSGSSGAPTLAAYTAADLRRWAELTAADLARAGVGRGSIVVNAYPYGLSTGGLGSAAGAELLGATVLPASMADPAEILRIVDVLPADVLLCTPNDAARLVEASEDAGMRPSDLPFTVAVLGGECWSETLRTRVEECLCAEAFNVYGLSEVIGPGVASECHRHEGLHVAHHDFFAEVVDPDGDDAVDPGHVGELVLTTLRKEAMPLARYRTGDLVTMSSGRCPCGFDGPTITVLGRIADRIGTTPAGRPLLPVTIEDHLLRMRSLSPFYEIVAEGGQLTVRAEATMPDGHGQLADELSSLAGHEVRLELVPKGGVPRRPGKARRLLGKHQQATG